LKGTEYAAHGSGAIKPFIREPIAESGIYPFLNSVVPMSTQAKRLKTIDRP
jgi:hypothetical protein